MKSPAPVNDDRLTCDLRIKSGGVTYVCTAARHPGSDSHYFRPVEES